METNAERDLPCGFIDGFPVAVGKRVVGTVRRVEEEERRYRCPACGQKAFWGR